MYQSAGFTVIPQIAECLGVPLYQRVVRGVAVNQQLDYDHQQHQQDHEPQTQTSPSVSVSVSVSDEVEDLYHLLREVKQKHPEVTGVSCGAIVSNYQRLRLENVCLRLGLTPLCFLWQRERLGLLDEVSG